MRSTVLDEAKFNKFHARVGFAGSAGQFGDGYILGIIAPALPLFAMQNEVSPLLMGLLGASALIGLFIGASFFGWLTDIVGRRVIFIGTMLAVAVLSIAQLWVEGAVWLFILRLFIGIAVGADYAVAPAVVAEFSPRRQRSTLLAMGPAIWTVGFVTAFVVGSLAFQGMEDGWRWMLATGAIPALVLLVFRLPIPESLRWLVNKGREADALHIIQVNIDSSAGMVDIVNGEETDEKNQESAWITLKEPFYRKRLIFVCLFWFCQIVPYFAVFTFLPTILEQLMSGSAFTQEITVNAFLLLGGVTGVIAISRVGRRTYAVVAFLALMLSTAGLGVWQGAPIWFILLCLGIFALVSSAMSSLDIVYPTELFPTETRGTAMGVAVAASRLGAAVGTFLLPLGMDTFGVHNVTLITAVVAGIGLVACILWAPETRGLSLAQAAQAPGTDNAKSVQSTNQDNSVHASASVPVANKKVKDL